MNENENDFEVLRRLLAFKSRETPPPGYFNNFPGQVIACIRAGEGGAPEHPFGEASWLLRLIQSFEFKQAFAGTFAGVLCMVLVFGIVYAERPEAAPQPLLTQSAQVTPQPGFPLPGNLGDFQSSGGLMATTNPVLNFGQVAWLLDQPGPLEMPVNFSLSGN